MKSTAHQPKKELITEPLASRIRPRAISEFVGQERLVGKGAPLREAIEKQQLFSFMLWGPPGCGKTTLARLYAQALDTEFHELSAVRAGKADIKKIIETEQHTTNAKPRILFLDEIHRFNKAQQDYLLPFVESGELTLIGATTENPSFEVISALLSRCRVFVLEPLADSAIKKILSHANIPLTPDSLDWLASYANGDARRALTILDFTHNTWGDVTAENLSLAAEKTIRFDKAGEEHYNTISAFIKSMRASQPDAALYYLARMLEGGEDPKFIARRMVIFASEDVGLAAPTALVVANAVFRACEIIGMPECAINLAHGVAYLAQCKKDRRAYNALRAAQAEVKQSGNLPIPLKIRNAPTNLMKELNYNEGYEAYTTQSLLPEKIKKKKFLPAS